MAEILGKKVKILQKCFHVWPRWKIWWINESRMRTNRNALMNPTPNIYKKNSFILLLRCMLRLETCFMLHMYPFCNNTHQKHIKILLKLKGMGYFCALLIGNIKKRIKLKTTHYAE